MTYIQHVNKEKIDLDNLGIRTIDIIIDAPSYEHNLETIEGMGGVVDLGSRLNPRNIKCMFRFTANDWIDFAKKRDEIFGIFESDKSFYIIEKRSTHKCWLVKVAEPFQVMQRGAFGYFEVNFIALKGRAESIGTSTQAKTFASDFMQDLPVTYTDYTDKYATKFKIYNPGALIDPRNINHYLKITYKGNSENLRLKNITTGDEWAYVGVTNPGDTIILEGVRSTKNNLSIFRQTNKRLITIAPGWNEFEIVGAPDAREYAVQANMPRKKINEIDKKNPITFEFRFIY